MIQNTSVTADGKEVVMHAFNTVLRQGVRPRRTRIRSIPLHAVAILYVLVVAVSVIYSWSIPLHRFDLSLTVSLYVALHYWTTVMYFGAATVICVALFMHVLHFRAHVIQKVVYGLILLCVFACAWFPCNKSRSVLTTNIHDFFAYSLVILIALSFILLLLLGKTKRQKLLGLFCTLFAVLFISAFAFNISSFKQTIFIWENVIIALFFLELSPIFSDR